MLAAGIEITTLPSDPCIVERLEREYRSIIEKCARKIDNFTNYGQIGARIRYNSEQRDEYGNLTSLRGLEYSF